MTDPLVRGAGSDAEERIAWVQSWCYGMKFMKYDRLHGTPIWADAPGTCEGKTLDLGNLMHGRGLYGDCRTVVPVSL